MNENQSISNSSEPKEVIDEDMDSDDDRENDIIEISNLKAEIVESPYKYDSHVSLINACKEAGEFEELRDARQKMQELFPLSEDIWLSWLQDEIKFCNVKCDEDREKITQLFEKAIKDYLSVPLWLEYIHFSIGGLDKPDGLAQIRNVCERALSNAGLHVTKGSNLWEAYRELENVVLAQYMPGDGVMENKGQEDQFDKQHKRIVGLFKRQLSVPLTDMKATLVEYREWEGSDIDKFTMQAYQTAVTKLSSLMMYEDRLTTDDPDDQGHLAAYTEYLDHEIKTSAPSRIQCLFERAITDNCLKPELWIKYTTYLDKQLKIKDLVLSVYERSVKNCPWSSPLWLAYLLALERHSQPHASVRSIFKQALSSCVTTANHSLQLWTMFCDYSRRRIDWTHEYKNELEEFREAVESAISEIYNAFGADGDPTCSLQRYHAYIEASHCKNIAKARALWQHVMSSGHGNDSSMWLEYYQLERAYGNKKHCRKILQQAVNSVRDWPEVIVDAFLLFERCEGTLEQYEEAKTRCEVQIGVISHRRQMAAEKEEKFAKPKKDSKPKPKNVTRQEPSSTSSFKVPQSYKADKTPSHQQIFKMPLPVLDEASATNNTNEPPPKKRCLDKLSSPSDTSSDKHTDTITSQELGTDKMSGRDSDPDKNMKTVFVSNLPYSITDDSLAALFAKCGELNDIRLVMNAKGTSKGFAYVEFTSKEACEQALRMDRQTVDGRPMYVSAFKEKERPTHFKYSTELEKCKLFISGLPPTCGKDALEKIFSEHGTVTTVRLVTYKNGVPKGLAYVEFSEEKMASQAILKTDGLMVGENKISVAISNPPTRKQPVKSRDESVPSLGSGKMETDQRGKVRTQLSMMPRAVSRVQTTTPTSSSQSSTDDQSTIQSQSSTQDKVADMEQVESSDDTTTKMSNSDFRAMLLKK